MAFDPTKPIENTQLDAPLMRNQLNALNDKIDNLPASSDVQQIVNDSITAQAAGPCDNVNYLNLTVSNPPTQAEVQRLADKIDEMLRASRRE